MKVFFTDSLAFCLLLRRSLFALIAFSGLSIEASQVIANWDVVPNQRFSEPFKVGVIAFHETGADVEFQINEGTPERITDPTWNDRTGSFEYWIEIDPADYADGLITLSATAIPDGDGHESRQLSDIPLYTNAGGTVGSSNVVWVDSAAGDDATGDGSEGLPYATIKKGVLSVADGGTVYLKAGEYKLTSIGGSNFTYWTTVAGAPGLSPDDVQILTYGQDDTSTGRYGKHHIRWHNLSMYCDRPAKWGTLFYFNNGHDAWFDGTVLYDKNGRWADSSLFNGAGSRAFVTNTRVRDVTNAGGTFHRNLLIENIGADVYRGFNNLTAINVTVKGMDRGETGAHPDFIQFHNPGALVENVTLYNIKVYDMLAQGIFGGNGSVEDIAFVNLLMEKDPPESAARSQLTDVWDHVLLWNISIVDQTFDFRDSSEITNFYLRNGVFANLTTDNPNHASIFIESAHTKQLASGQSTPLGANATLGNPLFVDESTDDYRLSETSPAYGTGVLSPGVPADVDGFLFNPEGPNRGAFAQSNPGSLQSADYTAHTVTATEEADGKTYMIQVQGAPNQRFQIESTDNLVDWVSHSPHYTDASGRIYLKDKGTGGARFYRLTPLYFPFHAP